MTLEPVIPKPQLQSRGSSCFPAPGLVQKFKNWIRPQASCEEVQDWINSSVDVNKDGIITQQELEAALRGFHMCLVEWKARRALKHADVNCNGQVDKEEINKLVNHARWHWGHAIHAWRLNR